MKWTKGKIESILFSGAEKLNKKNGEKKKERIDRMCPEKKDHVAVVTGAKQQKQNSTKWKEYRKFRRYSIQHCKQITFINDTDEESNDFFFVFGASNIIWSPESWVAEEMTENKIEYEKKI